jgi:hypothetical protein
MPPIHLLNELRYLVPSEFEAALLGANAFTKGANGWTKETKEHGVFVDLSRVEWIELGTLVQLVLMVESALKGGVMVTTALPLPRPRRSEREWIESSSVEGGPERAGLRIDRRKKALAFLNYLGFSEAVRPRHLGDLVKNLTLLENYDSGVTEPQAQSPGEAERDGYGEATGQQDLYRYFFPLTWVSSEGANQHRDMANFLAGVVGEPERGLTHIDADAIANVVLFELVDNVSKHAGEETQALVAAWARPEHSRFDVSHYLDCEKAYVDWLSKRQGSTVEIVVGDSGFGLPTELTGPFRRSQKLKTKRSGEWPTETARVLHWAFDRWSTSKPVHDFRGTRGLYRVDRIIKKYQGIITIRAGNQMAGWDHGGASYDEPVFVKRKLSQIPGTILRARMLSFRESPSFRLAPLRAPRSITFESVSLGSLTQGGISAAALSKLREALSEAQSNRPKCVVATLNDDTSDRHAVREALQQAVETRHPGTLVLCGLPGGWDVIEGEVNAINVRYEDESLGTESIHPEHFEIWDPVLVIGPQGESAWAGTNDSLSQLLDELINAEKGLLSPDRIREVIPEEDQRNAILRYLLNDTNLVTFHDDGNLELLVTLAEIVAHTKKSLVKYVSAGKQNEGVSPESVYRTPSLVLVKKWLDISIIVEKSAGVEMIMLALSKQVMNSPPWLQGPVKMILSDSSVSTVHLEAIKRYLNIEEKETIPGETGAPVLPGVRIVPTGARVIVYCDIIAAAEGVGRCLRQVRRDEGIPVAVVCVVDARENSNEPVELADMDVPVITLLDYNSLIIDEKAVGRTEAVNISPITRRAEQAIERPFNYKIGWKALYRLIRKNNALHFSHIGRPIGRHFTFYLDALPIAHQTEIIDAFDSVIDEVLQEWADSARIPTTELKPIEIWHPFPEPKPSEPARRFAEALKRSRADVKSIQSFRREPAYGHWVFAAADPVSSPTVVIIDWGALTGTTVTQAVRLAAEAGAARVLACIFLSQLSRDEEASIRSLKTLRVFAKKVVHSETVSLLPFTPDTELRLNFPEVAVRFLGSFPIEAYNSYECPVCQQRARLSQEDSEYPTNLLREFASFHHKQRLRLRDREEFVSGEPRDFDRRPLSARSALWMLQFRGLLVQALRSTQIRKAVVDRLEALEKKTTEDFAPFKALWLIQFLSVESQWLRRPPLYFKSARSTIAEMALRIALNPAIEEVDRLNAIIVLRTSKKNVFATRFSQLVTSVLPSELLVKQLLYDAFTYVNRPYHQTPIVFEPLRDQLRNVRENLENSELLQPSQVSEQIIETIDHLLSRTDARLAKARYRSYTPVEAWKELRRILITDYQEHRDAPEAMTRILSEINTYGSNIDRLLAEVDDGALAATLESEWLTRLNTNWSAPRDLLGNTLIELLARIRHILRSDEAKTALGHDDVPQLLELVDVKPSVAESEFSMVVRRISDDPHEILQSNNWETIRTKFGWLWEVIFKPAGQTGDGSRLIKFIDSSPRLLGETLKKIYIERQGTLPVHSIEGLDNLLAADRFVFCPEGLLTDLLGHLLDNITKHRDPNKDGPMRIRFTATDKNGIVSLTIWNDKTKEKTKEEEKESRGLGLSSLKRRLRPFEADLKPQFGNFKRWTSKVELGFQRWD